MPDAAFEDPRLAALYDVLDPDRSDLDAYAAIARELGARSLLDVGCGTGTFALGGGQVIAGWDQGVVGMKVGGRRRLVIPPHLGYGDRGAGSVIPPGETLIFVVDLLDVR